MQTAKDIMRTDLITISPETTTGEAIEILLDKQVSGLPVVDDQGQLAGVITEFGLLAAAYDSQVQLEPVSQHMTQQVQSISGDTPINEIADKLILHRIRRVPVVENGQLLGQISRRDVLRAVKHNNEYSALVN